MKAVLGAASRTIRAAIDFPEPYRRLSYGAAA